MKVNVCNASLLVFLLTLVGFQSFAHAEEKVRVGVILPLSGEGASWGQAFRNGITLAQEELSPAAKASIEVVYEDDKFSPVNSVSALNHLLTTGPLDVVFNVSSGTAKALAPITEQKHIPLIAIATDPEVGRGRRYAFNFWVTPEEETRILFPEALRRGYHNIARINSIQDGVLAVKKTFDEMNNGRIGVLLDEDYPPEVKDFHPFLTKLRSHKNVDAVLVALLPGQLGIFARQLREFGISVPMFGWETLEDINEVKISQGALIGAWYVNASDGDGSFLKKYRERFPDASSYVAGNGHDAMLLVGAAVDRRVPKDKIHEFLSTLKDFHGALGTFSATGDQRFSLPAAIKRVTSEGFEVVSE